MFNSKLIIAILDARVLPCTIAARYIPSYLDRDYIYLHHSVSVNAKDLAVHPPTVIRGEETHDAGDINGQPNTV